MRLHRGAILAVIVDVETRGIAQADRRRSAGVCAIPALADALYGDALGAEADGNRPEILRDVVDELAVGRQINNLLIDNPVMHPMPRRPRLTRVADEFFRKALPKPLVASFPRRSRKSPPRFVCIAAAEISELTREGVGLGLGGRVGSAFALVPTTQSRRPGSGRKQRRWP